MDFGDRFFYTEYIKFTIRLGEDCRDVDSSA
ncbi:hypothetical protein SAMN06295960_0730 [Paenibacillus aquistagni]|uniref:Uncharacterized protein n=1 Tax=Paenibacillus aquistagni TaxID=1852522 RepID=A0A1X7ISC3_9BACL|nr:hypothetical protein SAMN06295960_0730 [Paenibacillus aquistagni]